MMSTSFSENNQILSLKAIVLIQLQYKNMFVFLLYLCIQICFKNSKKIEDVKIREKGLQEIRQKL